ncbi:MAG: gamma-glutamyl-gamma-aminobutyrate hydrolase family protein [Hahellaceae bacterium]|nr:gamma-glutamyl-gamma-aminobutyrate hydrolase family protein [Hahellaceae bacterium]
MVGKHRLNRKPLVAVTGPDTRFPLAFWCTAWGVWFAGGNAVRLTPSNYHCHEKDKFQAIIIGGGSDIDPGLYEGDDVGLAKIDPERDAFEIEMIEHALHTHLPIMGICRGMQLINVVLGGSLYGDIRAMRFNTSNRRTPLPRKTAHLVSEGVLSAVFGCSRWRINSLHHQAIDRLGETLKVVARDLDDFVQAVESVNHRYMVGVQWHPEYLPYSRLNRRLFSRLLDAARHSDPEALYE